MLFKGLDSRHRQENAQLVPLVPVRVLWLSYSTFFQPSRFAANLVEFIGHAERLIWNATPYI